MRFIGALLVLLALAARARAGAPAPVTLVSAYYRIASKHAPEDYARWMEPFFRIAAPLVFFCNDTSEEARVRALRPPHLPPLHVIVLPLAEIDMNLVFDAQAWRYQLHADPERAHHRSPLLYQIWLQKTRFVTRAAEALAAPPDALFMWADAGFARLPQAADEIARGWPSPARLVEERAGADRLTLFVTSRAEFAERMAELCGVEPETYANEVMRTRNVAGSFAAGTVRAWRAWQDAFYDVVCRVVRSRSGAFIGKDQDAMTLTVRLRPDLVRLVDARTSGLDMWFVRLIDYFAAQPQHGADDAYAEVVVARECTPARAAAAAWAPHPLDARRIFWRATPCAGRTPLCGCAA